MTKKKIDITEWINARVAAQLLSIKHGRKVRPGYVNRIKNIQRFRVHPTMHLYLRSDVEAVQLRAANRKKMEAGNEKQR